MKRIFALALMFTSTVALAQNVLPAATGYEVALSWDAGVVRRAVELL